MSNTIQNNTGYPTVDPSQEALDRLKRGLDDITQFSAPLLSTWLFKIIGVQTEKIIWTKSCQTFATDGSCLLINPDYILTLSHDDLVFILLHEAGHCFLLHHVRKPSDCPNDKWNIFCDYVINRLLTNSGLTVPKGGLLDNDPKKFPYSAEDWWRDCKQNQEEEDGDDPDGDQDGEPTEDTPQEIEDFGGCGSIIQASNDDGSELSEEEKREIIEEHKTEVASAQLSVGKDFDPNCPINKIASRTTKTKKDWKVTLNSFFEPTGRDGRSFRKVNRRQGDDEDAVLNPVRPRSEIDNIGIAVDTSGSITNDGIAKCFNECQAILEQGQGFTLSKFSNGIHSKEKYEQGNIIDTTRYNGGTSTTAVVNDANENNYDGLVIFTDGELIHNPDVYPQCDVLWVIDYGGFDPVAEGYVNFGEVVFLDPDR